MKSIITLVGVIVFSASSFMVAPNVKVSSRLADNRPGRVLEEKVESKSAKVQKAVKPPEKAPEEPSPVVVPQVSVAPAKTQPTYVPMTSESEAKAFIYQKESGNRPDAINASSGACGLGQALPCSKLPCSLQDYACQDNWFTNSYMIPRYGSWANAKAFWLSHNWW